MINHKTVLKLMKSLNFQGKQRRSKYKSYKGEVGTVAPNILNRKFEATGEYEKLTTDVTEFSVCTEKVYLSPILDLYNNEIISYSISLSPNFAQTKEMLPFLFDYFKFSVPIIWHWKTFLWIFSKKFAPTEVRASFVRANILLLSLLQSLKTP